MKNITKSLLEQVMNSKNIIIEHIKVSLLLILLLFTKTHLGQIQISEKYSEYYYTINKAKHLITENKLDSSLILYENILNKFNFPFYKHIKQATLVAYYSNNESKFQYYLHKSITRGMTKNEFSFFVKKKKFSAIINQTEKKYDSLYNCYLSNIDSNKLISYQKLDAQDFFIHSYIYGYSNDSLKDVFHNTYQAKLIKQYIKLVDEIGYPSEKYIGLPKSSRYSMKKPKSKQKYNIVYINDTIRLYSNKLLKGYYITSKINPNYLIYSQWPGNWLLWHNAINVDTDSTLIVKIRDGVMNLELPVVFLTQMYENSHNNNNKYFSSNNDYATTYNSYTIRKKARSCLELYTNLNVNEKKAIDSLRRHILLPTLEDERKLILSLYFIKTETKELKLTQKVLDRIKFEYNAFISYYNI